jgi:antitoxin PrlF
MALAQSRITAQGQVSVPVGVRKSLGVGPGSVIEWDQQDGKITVRKVGRYSSDEIHSELFPDGPPQRRSLDDLKRGIAAQMREKHARD